jgi:ABC-2 type transport system ATP-binding protein
MLNLEAVAKKYENKTAVAALNLRVERGEFYALLGPNGAGKTTTLKMIAGLLLPDSGSIQIGGHDITQHPEAAKRLLAYLPDEPLLYGRLRPMEYLEFVAGLWGIAPRAAETRARKLLEELALWDLRTQYCEALSRGMQQKLVLAGALIHEPQLLILDEPLTGLDVAASRQIKDLLQDMTRHGMTVLFTTHILEVAERLATRIGLIQQGRLIAEGTLESLQQHYGLQGRSLEDVFLMATDLRGMDSQWTHQQ